jgi:osmotically-inducible protein OsmY
VGTPRKRRGAGLRFRPRDLGDDLEITARVRRALCADGALNASGIHIATLRRFVRLVGHVLTEAERERAQIAAASVSGVRNVINGLAVR